MIRIYQARQGSIVIWLGSKWYFYQKNRKMEHPGLDLWHRCFELKDSSLLDEFLHDDVIFYSPVVFTPQKGKMITKAYLLAASQSLADEFEYVRKVITKHQVVLEFECKIDGKYVNGVDMITFDDDMKCTEFKVLVRPLQAVNAIHQSMMRTLEAMKG